MAAEKATSKRSHLRSGRGSNCDVLLPDDNATGAAADLFALGAHTLLPRGARNRTAKIMASLPCFTRLQRPAASAPSVVQREIAMESMAN